MAITLNQVYHISTFYGKGKHVQFHDIYLNFVVRICFNGVQMMALFLIRCSFSCLYTQICMYSWHIMHHYWGGAVGFTCYKSMQMEPVYRQLFIQSKCLMFTSSMFQGVIFPGILVGLLHRWCLLSWLVVLLRYRC